MYGNRGDVTIFMNGFPIVQIELKKSGIELSKPCEQIQRYKQESFDKNIFKIIQLFIVSNDDITEYFSNNTTLNPRFSFK
ncbi:MAG: type I restriction endonuclease [Clostridia bacterium]